MPIIQATDGLHALEELFGIPSGYIDDLQYQDDWSIIIKSHAILESACTNMLTHYFGKEELDDIFTSLDMSNKKYGKTAFISALKLLGKKERSFISILSELRNIVVHNASNVCFSTTKYLENLEIDKRREVVKSLNIRLASIVIDGHVFNGNNMVIKYPNFVICSSLTWCLSRIYTQCLFGIERNKFITNVLKKEAKKGPKQINHKDITLKITK